MGGEWKTDPVFRYNYVNKQSCVLECVVIILNNGVHIIVEFCVSVWGYTCVLEIDRYLGINRKQSCVLEYTCIILNNGVHIIVEFCVNECVGTRTRVCWKSIGERENWLNECVIVKKRTAF